MPKTAVCQATRLAEFVEKNWSGDRMIYAGIDPGAEGAVGFVCGRTSVAVDIPTLQVAKSSGGKKTVFNFQEVLELFRPLKVVKDRVAFCLEKPPPSMGPNQGSAYGQFMLGMAYAMWPLFLLSKGYPLEEVAPAVWKKKMNIGKDKEANRYKALQMFPDSDLGLKKHHNRAEALLLAEYLRRITTGG